MSVRYNGISIEGGISFKYGKDRYDLDVGFLKSFQIDTFLDTIVPRVSNFAYLFKAWNPGDIRKFIRERFMLYSTTNLFDAKCSVRYILARWKTLHLTFAKLNKDIVQKICEEVLTDEGFCRRK